MNVRTTRLCLLVTELQKTQDFYAGVSVLAMPKSMAIQLRLNFQIFCCGLSPERDSLSGMVRQWS